MSHASIRVLLASVLLLASTVPSSARQSSPKADANASPGAAELTATSRRILPVRGLILHVPRDWSGTGDSPAFQVLDHRAVRFVSEAVPDLAPLHARPDFKALVSPVESAATTTTR